MIYVGAFLLIISYGRAVTIICLSTLELYLSGEEMFELTILSYGSLSVRLT